MTQDELNRIETAVVDYAGQFIAEAEFAEPYELKLTHTLGVRRNIRMLADSLNLDAASRNRAEAAALVHDLGRFPQFRDYQTFSDPASKNHAALSLAAILAKGIFKSLDGEERRLILRAVALHNRASLPDGLPCALGLLARMLRDADKLDIYRVITDLYQDASRRGPTYITYSLEDDGRINPDLVASLMASTRIPLSRVKTLNDMKLFQAGMVMDLNFPAAFNQVREKRVVPVILSTISSPDDLTPLAKALDRFMAGKAAG